LRNRVPNIDLGQTIISLIESPAKTLQQVFFAERKNFLLFILIFLAVKNSLVAQAVAALISGREFFSLEYVKWNILLLAGIVTVTSVLGGLILKLFKSRISIRQIATALLYPQLITVIILPVLAISEFIIFGKYLFYKTPNIFFTHPGFAYFFMIVEGLLYVWTILLNFAAYWQLASNRILAVIYTLIALFLIYILPYILLMYSHL
jgi:hypothetical protein